MICETIIRYDKEGKKIEINRIKSSSCYFIGFFIIALPFALPIFILTIIPNEFLAVFFMINLFFIAPLTFLYPTVRELNDGKDSLKNFLLTNIISTLVKVIIGILFSETKRKLRNKTKKK